MPRTARPRTRRASSALLALAIIGVTGGCATEDDKPKPEIDVISFMPRVIADIRAEGSLRVEVSVDGPDPYTASGDLVFRDYGETDLRFRGDTDGIGFSLVNVGRRLWLSYDEAIDGKYFEIDRRRGSPTVRELADEADYIDPVESLFPFQHAVTSVAIRGEPRSFGGVSTRMHHVVLDSSRINFLGGWPGLEDMAPEDFPPYFVYEMYLDDEGLLRHLEYSAGDIQATVDYLGFGSIERVEPPTRDEITTIDPFEGLDDIV